MGLTFKKFERVFNICIGIIIGSVILWALTDVLITQKVDLKNTTELEVHFKEIVKGKIEGKISYSYDLYDAYNYEIYKIAADNVHCFNLERFLQNVKRGDLIKVYINKNNGLKNPNLRSVVGIIANGENYIDTNCINERIEDNKVYIPMIFSISALVVGLSIYFKKRKGEEK